MHVQVALLPELLPPNWSSQSQTVAVVIDTLRFTTTACQALAAGATRIRVTAEIEQARMLAEHATDPLLLCGERACRPIPGFDLGNSPLEYTSQAVANQALLFTTTNGTRAVAAAKAARNIWLASLVNRRAIVRELQVAAPESIWIVCAGTEREVATEDVLTAGALLAELIPDEQQLRSLGDSAQLACYAWRSLAGSEGDPAALDVELPVALAAARGGHQLIETGFHADLEFAARIDSLGVVPKSTTAWHTFQLT